MIANETKRVRSMSDVKDGLIMPDVATHTTGLT